MTPLRSILMILVMANVALGYECPMCGSPCMCTNGGGNLPKEESSAISMVVPIAGQARAPMLQMPSMNLKNPVGTSKNKLPPAFVAKTAVSSNQ